MLSVVISCSRGEYLEGVIESWSNQSAPHSNYEVIVVDIGSNSGIREIVDRFYSPVGIRYFQLPEGNLNGARNLGIKEAKGDIILLSNDEILAHSHLAANHLECHRSYPGDEIAVLGYIKWPAGMKLTPFMRYLEIIRDQQIVLLAKGGSTSLYKHLYTYNISLKTRFLLENGLFDEGIEGTVHKDIELGYRLQGRGLRIILNKSALAYYFHRPSFEEYCLHQGLAGEVAASVSQKYPELKNSLLPSDEIYCREDVSKSIEDFKAAIRELEKVDLNLLDNLQIVKDREVSNTIMRVFDSCALPLLDYYYQQGVLKRLGANHGG